MRFSPAPTSILYDTMEVELRTPPSARSSTKVRESPAENNVCLLSAVTDRYVWDEKLLSDTDETFLDGTTTQSSALQHPNLSGNNAPNNVSGAAKNAGSVPRLDMSLLSSSDQTARKGLIEQMVHAAETWGFFQVVNHGVPETVVNDMLNSGRGFFQNVPVRVKEMAVETDNSKHTYYHGYGGRFQHLQAKVPWLEYLGECYHPNNGAVQLLNKVSDSYDDVQEFSNTTDRFSQELVNLGRQILEALAEGLDLQKDYFSQHFAESEAYQAHWRFNHYPACPEPSKTLGLGPHTDPCAMTIVTQDDVGGFQLLNGGRWINVQPLEKTFLVNVGDCLQAWTNGRFASVKHRVLANERDRLSVVFPLSPPCDYNIQIPPTLIDERHPLKYQSPIEWHHLAVVKGSHVKADVLSSNFALKQ